MLRKVGPAEVKAGPEAALKEREFVAYPSTFTRTPDSYGEVVKAGAFANTIAQWKASGNVMPGLFAHRMDDPSMFVAGATDMGEHDHGWWVRGVFDATPTALQVYSLVKSKRLSQLSFAYDVIDQGKVTVGDGEQANELRDVRLHEFSFVPICANSDTSVVAVKSTPTNRAATQTLILRLAILSAHP
ncbi:HK97 family phage prohead protease [Diaminobutyricibacter sp. McL0618]|uniref:HK97 family phage prohead protease n=1 Tax=Leifsonia sp. McL0618 TaxID=3415677 RepID=UPI003CF72F02